MQNEMKCNQLSLGLFRSLNERQNVFFSTLEVTPLTNVTRSGWGLK